MTDIKLPQKGYSQWQAMEVVWDIGISIAVPVVLFTLGGRWLDKRYGTSPFFILVGLFLSLAVSTLITVRKGKEIAKHL